MQKPPLFAEAEPCDQVAVAIDVAVIEVAKLPATLTNKLQQPTARVEIVLVRLKMRRQVLDAFRQDRHLYLGRPGVRPMDGEVPDQFVLALCG